LEDRVNLWRAALIGLTLVVCAGNKAYAAERAGTIADESEDALYRNAIDAARVGKTAPTYQLAGPYAQIARETREIIVQRRAREN
jgi:hypothetical protein